MNGVTMKYQLFTALAILSKLVLAVENFTIKFCNYSDSLTYNYTTYVENHWDNSGELGRGGVIARDTCKTVSGINDEIRIRYDDLFFALTNEKQNVLRFRLVNPVTDNPYLQRVNTQKSLNTSCWKDWPGTAQKNSLITIEIITVNNVDEVVISGKSWTCEVGDYSAMS
jgi:hypothetical protein